MATIVDSLIIRLGLDPEGVRRGLDEARRNAQRADQQFEQLGNKWKHKFAGIAMQVMAPLLSAVSIGAMVRSYANAVGEVAEATGAYSAKLEEARIKQAAIARVTKQDVELYVKVRKAINDFQISLGDLAARITRLFAPALEKGAELLNRLSGWLDRNGHNITRFLTVVATILTAALIPALIRMAAVLWRNPLTWIIALLAGLALVIDDLLVYMEGGESQLKDFWALFGTGAELSEKLGKAWEWIKTTGKDLLPYVLKIGAALAGWKIITVIGGLIKTALTSAITMATRFFAVIKAHPFMLLITAIWLLYDNWEEVCQGASDLWEDFCNLVNDLIDTAASYVAKAVEWIVQQWKDAIELVATGVNKVKEIFNNVCEAIKSAWNAMLDGIIERINKIAGGIKAVVGTAKEMVGMGGISEEERQATANDRSGYSADFEAQKAEILANRRAREAARAAGITPAMNAGTAATVKAGNTNNTVNNNQTITVNGAGDPNAVASKVVSLESSGRGITYAADTGVIQ